MYQKFIAVGRLGDEVQSKATVGGNTVSRFSVAVNEPAGEKKKTEWLKVVCFGKLAELSVRFLQKGSLVLVEGRLETRSWDDNGQKKYITEVIAQKLTFLDKNESQEEEMPF